LASTDKRGLWLWIRYEYDPGVLCSRHSVICFFFPCRWSVNEDLLSPRFLEWLSWIMMLLMQCQCYWQLWLQLMRAFSSSRSKGFVGFSLVPNAQCHVECKDYKCWKSLATHWEKFDVLDVYSRQLIWLELSE
jgi:hypothetical protein